MNDLRTAAQQALEALEDMLGWQSLAPQTIQESAKGRAAALKAALAEPVQEPVHEHEDWCASVTQLLLCDPPRKAPCNCKHTAPPPRKPLTEGEISNIWDGHVVPVFGKNGINPIVFARAIEAKHGIGGQQ